MDILEIAKQKKTGIITQGGEEVTLLFYKARGDRPLVGLIHKQDYDKAAMWSTEGSSNTVFLSDSLVVWEMEKHFQWSMLPGWADAYVFKDGSKWFCTSVEPVWNSTSERYKHQNNRNCTMEIPAIVTEGILWNPTNKESLTKNPKYADVQI